MTTLLADPRARARAVTALVAVGAAAYYINSAKAAREARAAAKAAAAATATAATATAAAGPAAEDAAGSRKRSSSSSSGKGDPMMRVFWLLFPFSSSSSSTARRSAGDVTTDAALARAGAFELIAIFIVSCLRTWHQDRMVYVKRDLMRATYLRDTDLFRTIMLQTVTLSFLSSGIFALHRYLKDRLTLVWRMKLTRLLHNLYFHDHNYYKLSHLNANQIADVEERITRDPRRFCKGLADEMEKMSAALTSGVWFTYRLTTISSLPYAVSPLIYFFFAFQISMTISPNWSKRWREMLDMKGVYEKLHTRVQTHAEAIAAYQGNAQERSIIENQWRAFLDYCVKFVRDASLFTFVASAFFDYGGHSFAEALIVGRFIPADAPGKAALRDAKTAHERVAASAALFSKVRFLTEYFIRAMASQGTIIAVMRQLQNMRGPAKRVTELFDALDQFETRRRENTTFKDAPDRIAFENVQVFTPTGHMLVKDLNFEIRKGTNMLLTGHNGSGKSSLFRCLGALWDVPEGGFITKPGGNASGLNKSVFYLPQRPYSVLGTLRDQLSYPAPHEEAKLIPNELLRELLAEVDLEYLMDRIGDDTEEVNWEDVLSLGEKQRLAAARLFYHAPTFAILDECTSGVSAAMEKRLYETCERRGVTVLTISHRPVLEQYHDVVLNIVGDGTGAWTWRETARGKARRESGGAITVAGPATTVTAPSRGGVDDGAAAVGGYTATYLSKDAGTERYHRQLERARSQKYDNSLAAKKKDPPQATTYRRLTDVMSKFAPRGWTLADPENRRILLLVSMIVAKTVLADAIARYDGYIVSTILESDWYVFARAIATGAFFRTFLAFFDAQILKHKWFLNLEWRRRLTKYLMDLYFSGSIFYDIKNRDDRIQDPDERIAEQVEQLSINLTDLWTALLKPAFDIFFSIAVLYRAVGFKGVALTSGYMLGGATLMRFVIPNFRALRRAEFDLEGRFRFVHTRLTVHTESVAFFGGDQVELGIAERRLRTLERQIEDSHLQSLRFNFFSNFSIKQTPDLIAFALRMLYATSKADDEAVVRDGGGDIANRGEFLQQTVGRAFVSFGEAFDLQETLGQFVGVLEQVTDFMYVLEDLVESRKRDDAGRVVPSTDGSISFEDVDVVAPGNVCIASDLTFRVVPGKSLVVSGPNSSGKSSLFRTMGGLWPIPKGTIRRPVDPVTGGLTPKQIFLVPQRPYSVVGSLADQSTYPERIAPADRTKEDEAKLMSLMELVRIPYLVKREGGWDASVKWEDVLSLGEQQRLNLCRAFYHEPAYCVLDECTSAVSKDVEFVLYKELFARGITCITLTQRLALEEFHSQELRFGEDDEQGKGWSIRDLPGA